LSISIPATQSTKKRNTFLNWSSI